MQSTSYTASATISQGDLLTIDLTETSFTRVYARPANDGDSIIGRAAQDAVQGQQIDITTLTPGGLTVLVSGSAITAGQHLAANNGKAVPGSTALVAVDSASAAGEKIRVVFTSSDLSPAIADKAKAIDTNGQYIGGPDKHMYLLNTGVPVASSANVGSDSQPMYLKSGQFKACTSVGGGAGEYCHLDELSTRDAVKSFTLGTTVGQQVKGYVMYNSNNGVFSIQWSLPTDQTQPMLVQGVLHQFYNTSTPTDKFPDVPIIIKVDGQKTWELDPSYYGGKMGNRAKFDCIISKA